MVQLPGSIECYLGALGLREMARGAGLDVCLPEFVSADEQVLREEGVSDFSAYRPGDVREEDLLPDLFV